MSFSHCSFDMSSIFNCILFNSLLYWNLHPLFSVFNFPYHMVPLTENDALRIEKNIGSKYIMKLKSGIKYIKCDEEGKCPFWDKDGRCSIYKLRGSSCRSYPFFIDKYSNLCVDSGCPGLGHGWTEKQKVIEMIYELEQIYSLHFKTIFILLKKG